MPRSIRMPENVVRASNPVQCPADGLELPDEVAALHLHIIHTPGDRH
jgi:hypothetical protein